MPRPTYRTDPRGFASAEEASRAIYIDFEGFKNKPPALIGILVDCAFRQVVLDPVLKIAGDAKGLSVREGQEVLERLLIRAQDEGRRIAAFTQHESFKAMEHFGIDLDPVYLNAHWLGKRWWKDGRTPLGKAKKGQKFSLDEFVRLLGLEPVPGHLGNQRATKKLKAIRDQCLKKEDYEAVSSGAKRHWTNLLTYNKLDVEHVAKLVRTAVL